MSLNLFVCYFLGDPGLQRYLALSGAGAEASCSAALRTAKAVVEEAGSSVSSALHKLAKTLSFFFRGRLKYIFVGYPYEDGTKSGKYRPYPALKWLSWSRTTTESMVV
jgi:hypothetical protein